MSDHPEFISMKLQCPLPKLNYEFITLGHGSGGVLTHRLLEDIIFNALGDRLIKQVHDAAIADLNGTPVISTDSFVVSPLHFPGGNIGDLCVNGTINDLAMAGARPRYLSLAFILEEGFLISAFWDILLSIRWACQLNNVMVITGDTKVVDKGSGDQLFINTTGIGELVTEIKFDGSTCKSGDVVIVSGPIASHGMAIMSVREHLEFETTIQSDTKAVYPEIELLLNNFGDRIKFLRDPTRGGIGTVLNEVARARNMGIELEQEKLPILPEVDAACELLGLDPIYVANEGIFLAVVESSAAEDVVEKLNSINGTQQAAIIGIINEDHPGKVVLRNSFGGRRVVNMLTGQQLPRIC